VIKAAGLKEKIRGTQALMICAKNHFTIALSISIVNTITSFKEVPLFLYKIVRNKKSSENGSF
jgi:hypothetical protein